MRFRNRQHAEQAKEAMEGCVLGKRPIRVGWGEASTQRNCVHVQAMTLPAPSPRPCPCLFTRISAHVQFDAALAERLMLAESDLETVRPRPRPSPRPKRSPSRSRSRSPSEAIPSHIHDPLLAGGAQAFTSCGAIESVQLPRTLDKVHLWSEPTALPLPMPRARALALALALRWQAHLRGYGFVHFVDQVSSPPPSGNISNPHPHPHSHPGPHPHPHLHPNPNPGRQRGERRAGHRAAAQQVRVRVRTLT